MASFYMLLRSKCKLNDENQPEGLRVAWKRSCVFIRNKISNGWATLCSGWI
jgi:hypothetical protein